MKKALLSIFMLSFVMVFISCNQSEQPINADNQSEDRIVNSGNDFEFYIPSVDELVAFKDATLEDEPEYYGDDRGDDRRGDGDDDRGDDRQGDGDDDRDGDRDLDGYRDRDGYCDRDGDRRHYRRHDGMFLGRVFRAMELSERQMYAVRGFMSDYMLCLRRVMAATMETRRAIMHLAREARMRIIRAYRSGDITRERASAPQLRHLNQRIREALRNEIDWTLRCRCIRNLFGNIHDILTRDQLAMWRRFINSLDGLCFGTDSRD